jgi:transcriptional regulator with XRE-family HTH domain
MTTQSPEQVFARRLKKVRARRGWSRATLEERIKELGYDESPLTGTIIAKIEAGKRRVSVDDMLVLCAALCVAPVNMLVPLWDPDELVDLAPDLVVRPGELYGWICGSYPLKDERLSSEDRAIFATEVPLAIFKARADEGARKGDGPMPITEMWAVDYTSGAVVDDPDVARDTAREIQEREREAAHRHPDKWTSVAKAARKGIPATDVDHDEE